MPSNSLDLKPGDKLLLVGAGKMGTALLKGWLDAGLASDQLIVLEPYPSQYLLSLQADHNFQIVSTAEAVLPLQPRIIVLAVKPQLAGEVLPNIKPLIASNDGSSKADRCCVLSLMAGLDLSRIESFCGRPADYVRTMPNTPASIECGITALYAADMITADNRTLSDALMGTVGKTIWVDKEELMDAVTAVSGSGPAYIFYMVEAMAAAGVRLGLEPDTAMELARETVIGVGAMLSQFDETASRLRENVTSPNGTTAAALDVLMRDQGGLRDIMLETQRAAAARSKELAKL
jgi:pyrroline-5-carboxylate reductase